MLRATQLPHARHWPIVLEYRSFARSFVCSFVRSFVLSFACSFFLSFACSFFRSFVRLCCLLGHLARYITINPHARGGEADWRQQCSGSVVESKKLESEASFVLRSRCCGANVRPRRALGTRDTCPASWNIVKVVGSDPWQNNRLRFWIYRYFSGAGVLVAFLKL